MEMYKRKTLYDIDPKTQIDEFGVDHSNFSTRDELEYNFKIAEQQQNQANYSSYGNDFSKDFIDKMQNDARFKEAMNKYIIPNEGGYINDPIDLGGETNLGISKKTYGNENIKNMTRERANALLYRDNWDWNGISSLPDEVVGPVFDFGVNSRALNAIQTVHKTLGINPVGTIIGKQTLQKINGMDKNEFLQQFKNNALSYYEDLVARRPENAKFLLGWKNRLNRNIP